MREDWDIRLFKDVFDLQMGKTPDRKNFSLFEGDNTWVSIKDLDSKYISSSKECISDEAAKNIKLVKRGTVIMSFKLTVGKTAIAGKDLYTNEAIMAFNLRNGYDIDASFLYYYLKNYRWEGSNKAVMGITLNKATISKHKIAIPPKPTQLSIVSELDKLNELIRIKKEQLKDYDTLAQSIFYEMFGDPVENEKGWKVKKLMEVCDVRDGTHDSPKYVESSNYMLITSKNIVNRAISFDDVNYITEEDYNNINKRSKVDNGDILMPMIGTIGNPVIVYLDNLHKFSIKNVALIKFLHNTSILNRYLLELMISESFRRYLLSLNKGGNQKFVALGTIRRMDIILPPLPLQQSFAHKIEQIDRQKAAVQRTIKDLETLLAARMQYWFE